MLALKRRKIKFKLRQRTALMRYFIYAFILKIRDKNLLITSSLERSQSGRKL